MNHWPFILGAYAVTALSTFALLGASLLRMRRAEAQADALRGER